MSGATTRSARRRNGRLWCPPTVTTPRHLHNSKSSGCGPECGRSPARSIMSPRPATTSNTVAAQFSAHRPRRRRHAARLSERVSSPRQLAVRRRGLGLARTALRLSRLDLGSRRRAQTSPQSQRIRRAVALPSFHSSLSASTPGRDWFSSTSISTLAPLADYLEAVPDDIGWLGLGDFRCYATMTVDVDANWKTIADGFSETYHIQTLHPELHRCMDDVYAPQMIWGHTGKSEQLYGLPSPHLKHVPDRRRGMGCLRVHPGSADGCRRRHAVPRSAMRPST